MWCREGVWGEVRTYLQPVATGLDQFSWNHWTCCEPSDVSVRRTRWRRGVEMVEGGIGIVDML